MLLEFSLLFQYFSKIFNMFLTKVQQSYCYTKLFNYRDKFVLKPNSNIHDYLVESYVRHLPSNQKCHKIVAPTRRGLFVLPLNLYG